MKEVTIDFILRVFGLFGEELARGYLWWRTDGEYAPLTFLLNCNDLFFWGCADAEPLTPENIDRLEKALADCRAVDEQEAKYHAVDLFIARERGERPQGAQYSGYPESYWPLFNEAGPEREVGFGNPYPNDNSYKEENSCSKKN